MAIRLSAEFRSSSILRHWFWLTNSKLLSGISCDMAQPYRLLASTSIMYDVGCVKSDSEPISLFLDRA